MRISEAARITRMAISERLAIRIERMGCMVMGRVSRSLAAYPAARSLHQVKLHSMDSMPKRLSRTGQGATAPIRRRVCVRTRAWHRPGAAPPLQPCPGLRPGGQRGGRRSCRGGPGAVSFAGERRRPSAHRGLPARKEAGQPALRAMEPFSPLPAGAGAVISWPFASRRAPPLVSAGREHGDRLGRLATAELRQVLPSTQSMASTPRTGCVREDPGTVVGVAPVWWRARVDVPALYNWSA